MVKHYLKIAWRSLMKNKVFSFINIFGLTVGLTSFLLIALYIFDELTFDGFHKQSANIYRVIADYVAADGTETKGNGVGYQVSEKSKAELPGIKEAVRLTRSGRTNISTFENKNVFYESFMMGNPAFLTTFDFKMAEGDRNTALSAPHSVIITEETAKKLFGSTNVLGKSIRADRDSVPFRITAILKDFPVNSHINFNFLFSEPANDNFKKFANNDWSSGAFTTYFLLNDETDVHTIESKINQFAAANRAPDVTDKTTYTLQPLKDIHFKSNDIEGDSGKQGNMMYIYVFSIVGLFVLLIACINYINLTTARFANRAKEIAVRKVTGASRKNLIGQFLSEAILITLMALVLALTAVEILLPYFNAFTEKKLALGIYTDLRLWLSIGSVVIIAGLLAGIYPALFQSRLKPFQLLKNKISTGKGNLSIRRSLVVFQFSLSIIMIIATMIVYLQMKYVNTKDMGFNKEQLLVVDINSGKVRKDAETIKSEFSKLAQVKTVSVSSRVPGEWKDIPAVRVKNNNTQAAGEEMFFLGIDDQFIKAYQLNLVKGRNFYAGSLADSSSVIVNESAAKALGISEPSGQPIEIPLDEGSFKGAVVGIVKDFNFQSLRQPLAPMVLGFKNNPVQAIDYFTLKVTAADISTTLTQMDAILHSIDQKHLLEYHFLDKQWELFYREDKIRESLFLIVALLTIIIACLGLFGLATYAAEQRIKEIGIRKVLGASVTGIVAMLSRDFVKLVLIASIIAFPVAWWAMNTWLKDFAYRITLSWWIFAVAGITALFIALVTVSFQAVKAAIANPVKSLRTE